MGKHITEQLKIPVVGAGPHTSGQASLLYFIFVKTSVQALVCDDVMGGSEHTAKFVRPFANLRALRVKTIQNFIVAIRNGSFPDPVNENYKTEKTEWDRFLCSDTGQPQ